jgi:hypothetical protein
MNWGKTEVATSNIAGFHYNVFNIQQINGTPSNIQITSIFVSGKYKIK